MAEQAVDAFVAMRAVEGEKMKADVAGRLTTIETLVAKIEENSAGRVKPTAISSTPACRSCWGIAASTRDAL